MMKINTFKRGFTLIELLVVIAIIGILASVVLASLNTARDKGADAAAKSSLNNMRAQAELVYDSATPNTYAAVCANATIAAALTAAGTATGNAAACADDTQQWGAQIQLKSGQYYCVDSTGKSSLNAGTHGIADGSDYTCI
jgi:prepilin-type N-terminal cleavage/methylation domain-containing protein